MIFLVLSLINVSGSHCEYNGLLAQRLLSGCVVVHHVVIDCVTRRGEARRVHGKGAGHVMEHMGQYVREIEEELNNLHYIGQHADKSAAWRRGFCEQHLSTCRYISRMEAGLL